MSEDEGKLRALSTSLKHGLEGIHDWTGQRNILALMDERIDVDSQAKSAARCRVHRGGGSQAAGPDTTPRVWKLVSVANHVSHKLGLSDCFPSF